MQKKDTRDLHIEIANKTMSYIYKYIDTPINIDTLARSFNISKIHLHKIFKEQLSINIYESITMLHRLLLINSKELFEIHF